MTLDYQRMPLIFGIKGAPQRSPDCLSGIRVKPFGGSGGRRDDENQRFSELTCFFFSENEVKGSPEILMKPTFEWNNTSESR